MRGRCAGVKTGTASQHDGELSLWRKRTRENRFVFGGLRSTPPPQTKTKPEKRSRNSSSLVGGGRHAWGEIALEYEAKEVRLVEGESLPVYRKGGRRACRWLTPKWKRRRAKSIAEEGLKVAERKDGGNGADRARHQPMTRRLGDYHPSRAKSANSPNDLQSLSGGRALPAGLESPTRKFHGKERMGCYEIFPKK